jgi:hypothetical protein
MATGPVTTVANPLGWTSTAGDPTWIPDALMKETPGYPWSEHGDDPVLVNFTENAQC